MKITNEIIESARYDYENEKISFEGLSERYGRNSQFWYRQGKEAKWVKYGTDSKSVIKEDKKPITSSTFDGILSNVAIRKIREIVEELGEHYNKIDEPMIVVYAKSYEYFIKLSKEVDEEGISLVSPKTGSQYSSPKFNAWLAVGKNIASIGEKLGITVSARKRIGIELGAKDKTDSLFDFVDSITNEKVKI